MSQGVDSFLWSKIDIRLISPVSTEIGGAAYLLQQIMHFGQYWNEDYIKMTPQNIYIF